MKRDDYFNPTCDNIIIMNGSSMYSDNDWESCNDDFVDPAISTHENVGRDHRGRRIYENRSTSSSPPPPLVSVTVFNTSTAATVGNSTGFVSGAGMNRSKSVFCMNNTGCETNNTSLTASLGSSNASSPPKLQLPEPPTQRSRCCNNSRSSSTGSDISLLSSFSAAPSTCTDVLISDSDNCHQRIHSKHQRQGHAMELNTNAGDVNFTEAMRQFLGDRSDVPQFDVYKGHSIRRVMEPYLRKARLARESATARNVLLQSSPTATFNPSASSPKSTSSFRFHSSSSRSSSSGSPPSLSHRVFQDKTKIATTPMNMMNPIGGNGGGRIGTVIPYLSLRKERAFLFDEHIHPLHTTLQNALNVPDLSLLHKLHPRQHHGLKQQQQHDNEILLPLLQQARRHPFHSVYDSFVTSHCIPLLHSMAIANKIFHPYENQSQQRQEHHLTYRYQAFPTIHVVRPGDDWTTLNDITNKDGLPTCDLIKNYSVGCLTFYIPLTPTSGTNALYIESHPGRENWHPLEAKKVGLGYLFDGSRCLHFGFTNTTQSTCVSLVFRVLIYRDCGPSISSLLLRLQQHHNQQQQHIFEQQLLDEFCSTYNDSDPVDGSNSSELCPLYLVEDTYSYAGPGYYNECVIDASPKPSSSNHRLQNQYQQSVTSSFGDIVIKKHGIELMDPDYRSGYPFTQIGTSITYEY